MCRPEVAGRLTCGEIVRRETDPKTGRRGDVAFGVLDPAAFAVISGPSIAETLLRSGAVFRRADNSRVSVPKKMGGAQAQASKITAERLLAELEEARSLALSLGQAGAAVAASMGRAKLCGLLVDRREDVTRRPTRDPDAPAEVAVEVWLREVAPQAGD